MPIPTPRDREEKQKFISRCMADDAMVEEFSNAEQRLAVCHDKWQKIRKTK